MALDLLASLRAPLFEARGLPHLEFLAQADKRDVGLQAGVRAKRFRKHDASVLIEAEDLHVTIERDRQLVALVRIVRQAIEKPVDFLRKALAACIERRSVERGVAVDAARIAVALQNGAEGRRHRDAALGVDLVRECRDKAVHPPFRTLPVTRPTPIPRMHHPIDAASVFAIAGRGARWVLYGITWDTMGVNGARMDRLWEIHGITRRDLRRQGVRPQRVSHAPT